MPATLPLEKPGLVDTTLPGGGTRRRVWTAPALRSHSAIALTLTRLYLAPAAEQIRRNTADTLQSTPDLDAAFGPLGVIIDLAQITRLRIDLLGNTLSIEYKVNGRASARVVIEADNHETVDELYTKIWRRLGDRFESRRSDPREHWELARGPVLAIGAVILLTLTAALGVNAAADESAGQWPDWRIVCGVGGAILALLQIWLYRRLTKPPVQLELVPRRV